MRFMRFVLQTKKNKSFDLRSVWDGKKRGGVGGEP